MLIEKLSITLSILIAITATIYFISDYHINNSSAVKLSNIYRNDIV